MHFLSPHLGGKKIKELENLEQGNNSDENIKASAGKTLCETMKDFKTRNGIANECL